MRWITQRRRKSRPRSWWRSPSRWLRRRKRQSRSPDDSAGPRISPPGLRKRPSSPSGTCPFVVLSRERRHWHSSFAAVLSALCLCRKHPRVDQALQAQSVRPNCLCMCLSACTALNTVRMCFVLVFCVCFLCVCFVWNSLNSVPGQRRGKEGIVWCSGRRCNVGRWLSLFLFTVVLSFVNDLVRFPGCNWLHHFVFVFFPSVFALFLFSFPFPRYVLN